MRQGLNRLSFALVVLATAVVGARWVSVVSAQPMGMYAVYTDWDAYMEEGTVSGFGSVDELDTNGCFHSDYRTWITLASPSRQVNRMEWGLSSMDALSFGEEYGWWNVSTGFSYFCNCGGGGQTVPTESSSIDLNVYAASDPAKLKECLAACDAGINAIENFCRSIPPVGPGRAIRFLCWANRWSTVACRGFCYYVWGD